MSSPQLLIMLTGRSNNHFQPLSHLLPDTIEAKTASSPLLQTPGQLLVSSDLVLTNECAGGFGEIFLPLDERGEA